MLVEQLELFSQISLYLIGTTLLGFFVGWNMSKSSVQKALGEELNAMQCKTNKDKKEIYALKLELEHYKDTTTSLIKKNDMQLLLLEEKNFSMSDLNDELDLMMSTINDKEHTIDQLKTNLDSTQKRANDIQQQYEAEIEAFINEREEIVKKFKGYQNQKNQIETILKKEPNIEDEKESDDFIYDMSHESVPQFECIDDCEEPKSERKSFFGKIVGLFRKKETPKEGE
ncbi:MAG: hypothetical protein KN64_11785 [Sulfurovum sp. AS07-7]|nr:MAG: hypothetical protein KN64_11785 [Sulfurovum sp. AS07-7]